MIDNAIDCWPASIALDWERLSVIDVAVAQKEHRDRIDAFIREVERVYTDLVLPNWDGELHGFTNTLYGYMMVVFAQIDLLSAYWRGDTSTRGQTNRMVDFVQRYMGYKREVASVAIQMWRHKLMHTSKPRYLHDKRTGKVYRWLLHWGEHLPESQHCTFSETSDSRILNLGLLYLVEDLKKGAESYLVDLSATLLLQSCYEKASKELDSYEFRVV